MNANARYFEFHDAIQSSLTISKSRVELTFSHISGYFETDQPELFDVKSCSGPLIITNARSANLSLPLVDRIEAADGVLLVNGHEVSLGREVSFAGNCRVSLTLVGYGERSGELIVEGSNVDFHCETVGRLMEQFHGAI